MGLELDTYFKSEHEDVSTYMVGIDVVVYCLMDGGGELLPLHISGEHHAGFVVEVVFPSHVDIGVETAGGAAVECKAVSERYAHDGRVSCGKEGDMCC